MERFLFISLTLALTVYGQIVMKSRALTMSSLGVNDKFRYVVAMLTDVLVFSALAAGVTAAVCWMLALQRTDIGLAYPFMALSFVLVPLAAAVLFKEPVSALQLVGLTIIVIGVAISTVFR